MQALTPSRASPASQPEATHLMLPRVHEALSGAMTDAHCSGVVGAGSREALAGLLALEAGVLGGTAPHPASVRSVPHARPTSIRMEVIRPDYQQVQVRNHRFLCTASCARSVGAARRVG